MLCLSVPPPPSPLPLSPPCLPPSLSVVDLNQRGLAILLRRIISFRHRSQRQLPHTKQTRQQRPGGDNVKSACDAALRKLKSALRRTQDPHKDIHKVIHKDGHQSHQPHYRVDTNRTHRWHRCSPPATPWPPIIAGRWCCCDPRFS